VILHFALACRPRCRRPLACKLALLAEARREAHIASVGSRCENDLGPILALGISSGLGLRECPALCCEVNLGRPRALENVILLPSAMAEAERRQLAFDAGWARGSHGPAVANSHMLSLSLPHHLTGQAAAKVEPPTVKFE